MSRRTMLVTFVVVLALGLAGACYVGWRWHSRDRVAVGTYRLALPEGTDMAGVVTAERELLASDGVLRDVIGDLELTAHWGFADEEETLAHMREKLKLRSGQEPGTLVVIYRDRDQQMALEILEAVNERYVALKRRQSQFMER